MQVEGRVELVCSPSGGDAMNALFFGANLRGFEYHFFKKKKKRELLETGFRD